MHTDVHARLVAGDHSFVEDLKKFVGTQTIMQYCSQNFAHSYLNFAS
jgi:hypothetical protein